MTFVSLLSAMVCLQDAEQGLLGQTVSPDAAASMVVAVISGLGLATVPLASLELTAVQVSQKTLHLFILQNVFLHSFIIMIWSYCFWDVGRFSIILVLENSGEPRLRRPTRPMK